MNQQLATAFHAFGLADTPAQLPGGSQPIFRIGSVVLKRIHETALENNHSPQLAQWIADISARLEPRGFRLAQPIAAADGRWITDDGWAAWRFLEGRPASSADIPSCIAAIIALHQALQGIDRHPLMDDNRTPWGIAHRQCWGAPPAAIQPQIRPLISQLYALRQPIQTSPSQLIHGDLNVENILIADGQPPAFLDFSPFWAPAEFALAIFANWAGPRRGDSAALRQFAHIPNFTQLLIRAALRMLLVMVAIDRLGGWDRSAEKRAAELVVAYAEDQR